MTESECLADLARTHRIDSPLGSRLADAIRKLVDDGRILPIPNPQPWDGKSNNWDWYPATTDASVGAVGEIKWLGERGWCVAGKAYSDTHGWARVWYRLPERYLKALGHERAS